MENNKNSYNNEGKISWESDRKQHIGILEEVKAKIEKESWTKFISKCKI